MSNYSEPHLLRHRLGSCTSQYTSQASFLHPGQVEHLLQNNCLKFWRRKQKQSHLSWSHRKNQERLKKTLSWSILYNYFICTPS